jgi:hypothetical protein
MIRYTASEARRELFRLLDSVEKGEEVILERKGIRFRLLLDRVSKDEEKPVKRLEVVDREVLSGQWTWAADRDGQLHFQARETEK